MSIDAVAVLRITGLEAPAAPYGSHPVTHSGNASLLNMMNRRGKADALMRTANAWGSGFLR